MELLNKLLSNLEWAIAGLIGALLAAPFHAEVKTPAERAWFALTGMFCAYWLTGLVSTYFSIDPAVAGGVGFLLGAFGGSMLAAIIKAIKAADLWALLKQRFGGGSE